MATDDERKQGELKKGFAGLSSLVSADVDAAVQSAPKPHRRAADASTSRPPIEESSKEQGQAYEQPSAQASPRKTDSSWKWLLGIIGVIGFLWLLANSGNKSAPSSPSYTPPSSSYTPSSPSPAPSREAAPAPRAPAAPTRPLEEKPPVGTNNVLSVAQIRYCVAEDIRLDAAKGVVNNYVEAEVDRFNAMVADYNGRCGQYRYRRGALESARADIEPMRNLLESEGRSRFSPQPRSRVPSTQPRSESEPPTSVVQQVQHLLNQLGYDAGVADGIAGQKTFNAIIAFQRDNELETDGEASTWLLTALTKKQQERQRKASVNSPSRTSTAPRSASAPSLTSEERQSIESACSNDKHLRGPAAYNACVGDQVTALERQGPRPDLSRLNTAERQSIESACSNEKYLRGPAAYHGCLSGQLQGLSRQNMRPDISGLTAGERQSIESACSNEKYLRGPAAYNACVTKQMQALERQGAAPDLSKLNSAERQSIDSACSNEKYLRGPAAYNACLSQQVQALQRQGPRPDLSGLSSVERQSIESACSNDKYLRGPAAYNACLARQVSQR